MTFRQLEINNQQVIIKSLKPIHSDARGWIVSPLLIDSDDLTGHHQPRLISTAPGQIRGNHFHRRETETIVFLNNRWQAVFADPSVSSKHPIDLDCTKLPVLIQIPPNVAHAFLNPTNGINYLYHFSDQPGTTDRSIKIKLI